MSTILVPDYSMGGGCTEAPEEAMRNRDWAYPFLRPIFSPSVNGEAHHRDSPHLSGARGDANFTCFLQLSARFRDGRPLSRTVYFFAERAKFIEGYRDHSY